MPQPASKKSWAYTLNNYTDQELTNLRLWEVKQHYASAETCPTTGTAHLQGYIVFPSGYRLTQLKKLLPRAHWEPWRCKDHRNYHLKADSTLMISQNNGHQGHRTDLEEAIATRRLHGIHKTARDHPAVFVKFGRGLQHQALMELDPPPVVRPLTVTVLVDPASLRQVYIDLADSAYDLPPAEGGKMWFDGYLDQPNLIIGPGLLKSLTGTQISACLSDIRKQVPVKNGFVWARWNHVYVSAPPDWRTTYPYTMLV